MPGRAERYSVRRLLALLGCLIAVGATAGCATVPALPGQPALRPEQIRALDLTSGIPVYSVDEADISPDGFDAIQRTAARVRNIGCGEIVIGSGFAIDDHTLITNRHVVANSQQIQVSTYDGRDVAVTAAALADFSDLAVVVAQDSLPAYTQLAAADPVIGERISVVGFPAGGRLTVTSGRILGSAQDPLRANLGEILVTDAPLAPGSSGSPALNEAGEVVGVVYAGADSGQTLLVPVTTLREMLDNPGALTPLQGSC